MKMSQKLAAQIIEGLLGDTISEDTGCTAGPSTRTDACRIPLTNRGGAETSIPFFSGFEMRQNQKKF